MPFFQGGHASTSADDKQILRQPTPADFAVSRATLTPAGETPALQFGRASPHRFRHSLFGGSGSPWARLAVRKWTLATFGRLSAPCLATNSFAAASTAADAPLGSSISNCFSSLAIRETNSLRARMDAAATAMSSS